MGLLQSKEISLLLVSHNFLRWSSSLMPSSTLDGANVKAMFTAIGVGYSSSLPSAAALNWVLKDGLGRLSRCIYTASLASAFDTNLKKEASFPKLFLLLATIANIAKQISLGCYLATRSGYSLRTFTGHSAYVMSLDFHPNKDDLICSCDGDESLRHCPFILEKEENEKAENEVEETKGGINQGKTRRK
ncbi:hypothetical protein P8452_47609 [Trifolium repens]|nr:hypothetical protein P8452_47609 [Trifolium repens]